MSQSYQPLDNTANTNTAGLGHNSQKITVGDIGGPGNGNTTGIQNPARAGYGKGHGVGGGTYNNNAGSGIGISNLPAQQGPYGAGTGADIRKNDGIAKPIDWEAINAGRGGRAGEQFGLTGRAGIGGGVGHPMNEDLTALNEPGLTPGAHVLPGQHANLDAGSAGLGTQGQHRHDHDHHHAGRDAALGGAGVAGLEHERHKHDHQHRDGQHGQGIQGGNYDNNNNSHFGRDAAIGGVGAAGLEHEHRKHEHERRDGDYAQGGNFDNSNNNNSHLGRDAALGGVGAAGLEHEHRKHEHERSDGDYGQGGNFDDSNNNNVGRHGAEAGALAGGVGGHHDGHTGRDAALGVGAGGIAGHEYREHEQNTTGIKIDVLKPNHNANDPANQDSYDTTSGGADHTTVTRGTGLGPTNVGPGAPNY